MNIQVNLDDKTEEHFRMPFTVKLIWGSWYFWYLSDSVLEVCTWLIWPVGTTDPLTVMDTSPLQKSVMEVALNEMVFCVLSLSTGTSSRLMRRMMICGRVMAGWLQICLRTHSWVSWGHGPKESWLQWTGTYAKNLISVSNMTL